MIPRLRAMLLHAMQSALLALLLVRCLMLGKCKANHTLSQTADQLERHNVSRGVLETIWASLISVELIPTCFCTFSLFRSWPRDPSSPLQGLTVWTWVAHGQRQRQKADREKRAVDKLIDEAVDTALLVRTLAASYVQPHSQSGRVSGLWMMVPAAASASRPSWRRLQHKQQ